MRTLATILLLCLLSCTFSQAQGVWPVGGSSAIAFGPPNFYGARRASGHELDIVQLNLPFGQTASSYCPTRTQANSLGCLPNLGGLTGAGQTMTDGLGGQLMRVTDSVTEPGKNAFQQYVNLQGNTEQANTVSINDDFLCIGRTSSGLNYVLPFAWGAASHPLWPGNGTAAFGFNWCTASRVTDGLYYDISVASPFPTGITYPGVLFSVNAATDPARNTLGGTPTPAIINDFTLSTDKCFGTSAAGGRYAPFVPTGISQSNITINDDVISFTMDSVRNGCFDPHNGVLDWQPTAAYSSTATTCGTITCGSTAQFGALCTGSVITPMSNNAGGHVYCATATGTSGAAAPTWCQTASCTITGDGTVNWKEIGVQNNYSGLTGAITNSCGTPQAFATLFVAYHVTTGGGENAGDCDLYDTWQGVAYHNGVSTGTVDQGTFGGFGTKGAPYLYAIHQGLSTLNPTAMANSMDSAECFATPTGGSCSSNFLNNCCVWHPNTGTGGTSGDVITAGATPSLGHATFGYGYQFGATTNPIMRQDAVSSIAATTPIEYMMPLTPFASGSPGCPNTASGTITFASTSSTSGTYATGTAFSSAWNGYMVTINNELVPHFISSASGTTMTLTAASGVSGTVSFIVDAPPVVLGGTNTNTTCYGNGVYTSNPNTNYPANFGPGQHLAANSDVGGLATDKGFIAGMYNPTAGYNGFDRPYVDPLLGELDIFPTSGYNFPIRECQTQSTEGSYFASRYHSFALSNSGKYVFFTSDGMNTFGPSSANACGADWQPNTVYAPNTTIVPLANNPPGNANNNNCYWTTTAGGTSGSTVPNWQSTSGVNCTAGLTLTDNGITWTVGGFSACRSDILACKLL